jgi:Family of unknown function (DUF6114)
VLRYGCTIAEAPSDQNVNVGLPPPPPPPAPGWVGATGPPYVSRPTAPFALALLGGVTIMVGGLVQLTLLNVAGGITFFGISLWISGPLGILLGAGVIYFASRFYEHPEQVVLYGSIVTALSAVSYLSFLGGYFLGLILGVVGGVLAIVWRPVPSPPFYYPAMPAYPAYRTCLKCGHHSSMDARFCAYCGNPFN